MREQEQYKKMLEKIINETENFKIQSTEELIQVLITELAQFNPLAQKATAFQANSLGE